MRLTYEGASWREYRYVVCGGCGKVYNIAREQDTRHGYLCPACTMKRSVSANDKM